MNRTATSHSTYQATLEVGRAVKTILVARYPQDRDLQSEIHDGRNVAEGRNGGNQVLFYGEGGDIAINRRDEQELSVACLHGAGRDAPHGSSYDVKAC